MARVLLVDDDAGFRTVVREFLHHAGHTVLEAENAQQAYDLFARERVDLVVCDLVLPVTSGLEVLRVLKHKHPQLLFVMVTGYPSPEAQVAALREGAYDFLTKPLDMTQLTAVMSRALDTVQLRARLSTLRGVNVALLISIPFWVVIGILVWVFLIR